MADSFETFQWEQLARRQKIYIVAAVAVVLVIIGYGFYDRYRLNSEIRVFENQAIEAKREAQAALETAVRIAKEKIEAEKKSAELEAKRDGKVTEVESAKVKAADDRLELNRVRRGRRGDNPSAEQLCGELAALGYPCR